MQLDQLIRENVLGNTTAKNSKNVRILQRRDFETEIHDSSFNDVFSDTASNCSRGTLFSNMTPPPTLEMDEYLSDDFSDTDPDAATKTTPSPDCDNEDI